MDRTYHSYKKWEDYRAGFYNNCSGSVKKEMIEQVIIMFSDAKLTKKYMEQVITDWVYSCEHNLSNDSLNKIAYIGQAACCIFAGVPSTVTMEAWNLLTPEIQERADRIANHILNTWIKNQTDAKI
jgi:hypothetical protein